MTYFQIFSLGNPEKQNNNPSHPFPTLLFNRQVL